MGPRARCLFSASRRWVARSNATHRARKTKRACKPDPTAVDQGIGFASLVDFNSCWQHNVLFWCPKTPVSRGARPLGSANFDAKHEQFPSFLVVSRKPGRYEPILRFRVITISILGRIEQGGQERGPCCGASRAMLVLCIATMGCSI